MGCWFWIRDKPSTCEPRALSVKEEYGCSFPGDSFCKPPWLVGRLLLLFLSPIGVRPLALRLSLAAGGLTAAMSGLGGRGGRPRPHPVNDVLRTVDERSSNFDGGAVGPLVCALTGDSERERCAPTVGELLPLLPGLAERPSAARNIWKVFYLMHVVTPSTRPCQFSVPTEVQCTPSIHAHLCCHPSQQLKL